MSKADSTFLHEADSNPSGMTDSMNFNEPDSSLSATETADFAMSALNMDVQATLTNDTASFEPAIASSLDFDLGGTNDSSLNLPSSESEVTLGNAATTLGTDASTDKNSENVMDFDLGSFGMDSLVPAEATAATLTEDTFAGLPELETAGNCSGNTPIKY